MIKFKDLILDMAKPRKEDLAKTYYHGTSKDSNASNIIRKGYLRPREITTIEYSMTPDKGKVYVTSDLEYAVIYSLGANIIGQKDSSFLKNKKFGYLFVIDGKELKDIEPDEDSIGEMVYDKEPKWLFNLAKKVLSGQDFSSYPSDIVDELEIFGYGYDLFDLVMDGNYAAWAYSGKLLLKELSDSEKLYLISLGAHVAHKGKIKIKEAWRLDLKDNYKLKSNASNFFKIAKRIK